MRLKLWAFGHLCALVFLFTGGMAHASPVQEPEISLLMEIDAIQLVADPDAFEASAAYVFQKEGGGKSALPLVDLMQEVFAKGVEIHLERPASGTYPTALVYFNRLEAVHEQASGFNVMQAFASTLFFPLPDGRYVLVMGEKGTGSESVYATVMQSQGQSLAMQPITVAGASFRMPALNLNVPQEKFAVENGAVVLVEGFSPATLSRDVDNAAIGNFELSFDPAAFMSSAPLLEQGFMAGTSQLTVGLFESHLPARPLLLKQVRHDGAAEEQRVLFFDVPEGLPLIPIIWFDTNHNGLLDTGEMFSIYREEVAQAAFVMGRDDTDYQSLGGGFISLRAQAFGARSVDVEMPLASTQTVSGLDALNYASFAHSALHTTASVNFSGRQVEEFRNKVQLHVAYPLYAPQGGPIIQRHIALTGSLGQLSAKNPTVGVLWSGDAMALVLTHGALGQEGFQGMHGVRYLAQEQMLLLENIPYTRFVRIGENQVGVYQLQFQLKVPFASGLRQTALYTYTPDSHTSAPHTLTTAGEERARVRLPLLQLGSL